MTLIRGAEGIFTGLPGEAMRANGAIRIEGDRIAAIGDNLERAMLQKRRGPRPQVEHDIEKRSIETAD